MKISLATAFWKKNAFWCLCLLDILIFGAYFEFVLGWHRDNEVMKQSIVDERLKQELILNRGVSIVNENFEIEFGGGKKELIAGSFVPKEKALDFITTLEAMAEKEHLDSLLNLGKVDNKDNVIQQVDLQLSLVGDFSGLMRYLRELEKMTYYVQIRDISFLRALQNSSPLAGTSEQKDVIRMDIKAITFWN